MRRQFLFAGALLGVCFSTSASFAATNLVGNPSFESRTPDVDGSLPDVWSLTQGAGGDYTDPNNAVDGTRYAQIGNYGLLVQWLPYTPAAGDVIHVSSYAHDFGSAGAFQTSLWFDPTGTSVANMDSAPGATRPLELDGGNANQAMTLFQGDYTVDPSLAGKMVGIYLSTGPGYAAYDDISVTVTPAPEPASLSLFGAGAALLLRRRRVRVA
jgi:hypothetical protein